MTAAPALRSFHSGLLPSEFVSSIGARLIKVTAGSFVMGSPENEPGRGAGEEQHDVTLTHDYFLGETPVTQGQYAALTGENPTQFQRDQHQDAPVVSLGWQRAGEFCRQLTERDQRARVLPGDWEYRLPTEAEWEYAARAENPGARYGDLAAIAWYNGNSKQSPHPVGQKLPNGWGFCDLLGNVWEFCQDWFHVRHKQHAVRGGSFFNSAAGCRFAARERWGGGRYVGFRLLAGPAGIACTPANATFPIDNIKIGRQPGIYDAIDANDFDLALRVIAADQAEVESADEIPPPLHACIYDDKQEWLEWLLDHGADIERREQDYGSTPLTAAIVHRHQRIIRTLVARGADTSDAMASAERGLAGAYEDDQRLDREGYRKIVELLRELGIH